MPLNSSYLFECFKDSEQIVSFCIGGVLVVIIGTFGIIGNIMTILVLLQPNLRNRTFNQLLICLAIIDILCILSRGIWFSSLSFSIACNIVTETNEVLECITYPMRMMSLTASIYMTLAISLERFIRICWEKLIFIKRKSWLYIAFVITFSILINLPNSFEMNLLYQNGTLICQESFAEILTSEESTLIKMIVNIIVPLVVIFVLNGMIILKIFITSKEVNRIGAGSRSCLSKTKILLWIVFLYLFFSLPRFVARTTDFYRGVWLRPTINLSLVCNSSVNFIIYCLCGSTFRKELRIFCKRKMSRSFNHQETTTSSLHSQN